MNPQYLICQLYHFWEKQNKCVRNRTCKDDVSIHHLLKQSNFFHWFSWFFQWVKKKRRRRRIQLKVYLYKTWKKEEEEEKRKEGKEWKYSCDKIFFLHYSFRLISLSGYFYVKNLNTLSLIECSIRSNRCYFHFGEILFVKTWHLDAFHSIVTFLCTQFYTNERKKTNLSIN